MIRYFLTLVSLLLITTAFAQPLSTDRPDATEGSFVMEKGVLQFELGYFKGESEILDFETESCGTAALIRYGFVKNLELRLGLSTSRLTIDDEETKGMNPISLGFKTNFIQESKYIPEISFLGELLLSGTGAEDFQVDHTAPSFRFLLSKELNDIFSLGANIGMVWNGFDGDSDGLSTLVLGVAVTDWLGAFFELESYYSGELVGNNHFFNTGFTIWLANHTQLDFAYSTNLKSEVEESLISIGVSQRLFK